MEVKARLKNLKVGDDPRKDLHVQSYDMTEGTNPVTRICPRASNDRNTENEEVI